MHREYVPVWWGLVHGLQFYLNKVLKYMLKLLYKEDQFNLMSAFEIEYLPSGHITLKQHRFKVDAMS